MAQRRDSYRSARDVTTYRADRDSRSILIAPHCSFAGRYLQGRSDSTDGSVSGWCDGEHEPPRLARDHNAAAAC